MEGSISDQQRIIQTPSYLLWAHKFTSHFPNYDERTLTRPNQYWEGPCVHRQHSHFH